MPTQIEARRLSGVDLGKFVTVHFVKSGRVWREGTLTRVEHRTDDEGYEVIADLSGAPYTIRLRPDDMITITGRPS